MLVPTNAFAAFTIASSKFDEGQGIDDAVGVGDAAESDACGVGMLTPGGIVGSDDNGGSVGKLDNGGSVGSPGGGENAIGNWLAHGEGVGVGCCA